MNTTNETIQDTTFGAETMRTLVGIDREGTYAPALELLGRLQFAGNQVTLAYVDAPVGQMLLNMPAMYGFSPSADLEGKLRTLGMRKLNEAADLAQQAGLGGSKTQYLVGNPAEALMDAADQSRADLVAIGSQHHGPMECFLMGSVGRALAIGGQQSFLVARGGLRTTGKLKAVFATDHSEYANRCFARLLDMKPEGLSHVTVMTATQSTLERTFAPELAGFAEASITEAETAMRGLGESMVGRLAGRGISAEYRLVEGVPEEAIQRTMRETGADLLILGARGHGLFERVLIGSLALHTVVAESYNTLVLRLPNA